MKVLGIETSCDETAVAIIDSDKTIHSNLVLSQIDIHRIYGGVVPEVAARAHAEHLDRLIKQSLEESDLELKDIDAFAATCGPGLIGGVMIGMVSAKALAYACDKPFLAINHLEGHALTPRLSNDVPFPYLLLLVSGGHTQILLVEGVGQYQMLGTTLDDAAGECFDKVAKSMGLPYPGGPELEKLASMCTDGETALKTYNLPHPLKGQDNCNFSFSGLKSAVIRHIDAIDDKDFTRENLSGLAYATQYVITDVLTDRVSHGLEVLKKAGGKDLVVAGGVAANKNIRASLEALAQENDIRFTAPPLKLCTDNAAMIAWAGLEKLGQGMVDNLSFKARPRWPLEELMNKNA